MSFHRSSPHVFLASEVQCHANHPRTDQCGYRVAWSINPHMRAGTGDVRVAAVQHRALLAALTEERVGVVELPFVHGAFDSVFTKDAAILLSGRAGRVALVSNPRHPERRRERDARMRAYSLLGFDTLTADGAVWEGGDVAMLPDGTSAFLGCGQRSDRRAAKELERRLLVEVIPVELCDSRLFHLDMALTMLPDGTALVCKEALTSDAQRALEQARSVREVVPIPHAEALGFGLNIVVAAGVAFLGGQAPTVERALRLRGLRPRVVPVPEFHLAGGSVACLLAGVHQQPAEIVPLRAAAAG